MGHQASMALSPETKSQSSQRRTTERTALQRRRRWFPIMLRWSSTAVSLLVIFLLFYRHSQPQPATPVDANGGVTAEAPATDNGDVPFWKFWAQPQAEPVEPAIEPGTLSTGQSGDAGPEAMIAESGRMAPVITSQPLNTSASVGQVASFSVMAHGTAPMTVQWQKNGDDIPGANGASYTTPPTTLADNGAVFRVVIGNSEGTSASKDATLTVMPRAAVAPTSTKPGEITDLRVVSIGPNSVTLSFTEVTNGRGAPANYDIRYSTKLSEWGWGEALSATQGSAATPILGVAIGNQRFITVEGLDSGTSYEFQMVAFRGIMNRNAVFGALSNIAVMTHPTPTGAN